MNNELELNQNVSSTDKRVRGTWHSQDIAAARFDSAPCGDSATETCAFVIQLSKSMKPGETAWLPKGTEFKIQRFQGGEIYLSWGLKRYLRLVCASSR